MNVFAVRVAELIQDRPELTAAVVPLLKAREVIERQTQSGHQGIDPSETSL
jgi:transposase